MPNDDTKIKTTSPSARTSQIDVEQLSPKEMVARSSFRMNSSDMSRCKEQQTHHPAWSRFQELFECETEELVFKFAQNEKRDLQFGNGSDTICPGEGVGEFICRGPGAVELNALSLAIKMRYLSAAAKR